MQPQFTTVQHRTWVTVEKIDTMLVIFRRKNLEKVEKLRAPWKIMSMKITSTDCNNTLSLIQTQNLK